MNKTDWACAVCGSTDNVQAHDPMRTHKDPSTGIPLCAFCHAKEHPEMPLGLFTSIPITKRWQNIAASTIARQAQCHSRTVVRHANQLGLLEESSLSLQQVVALLAAIKRPPKEPKPHKPRMVKPNGSDIVINGDNYMAYFPKELIDDGFVGKVKLIDHVTTITLIKPDANLESIIRSLEITIKDLKIRNAQSQ